MATKKEAVRPAKAKKQKATDTKEKQLTARQIAAAEKEKQKEVADKLKKQADNYTQKMFSESLLNTLDLIGTTEILDAVETQFHIAVSSTDTDARKDTRVSTGLLMTDMMLAGGIYGGGWYTILGPESSCKTTQLISWVAKLYESDVPIVAWWDYEGSTTPDYIQNILEAQGSNIDVRHIFGMRHPDFPDRWIIPPRMRYYAESEGERFYIAMGQMLKSLPDKVCVNGDWYLGFERTKQNISKYKGKYDTKLSSKFGKLMVPSPNGGAIQALIILDSFPAMTPADDDDGEGSKGLALDARMHAKHYKKVRSKLKRKNATLVGVNQIRLNPGARFGNPEYEPCGMALKHASDARIRQSPRAIPHGSGQIEEEPSVLISGGVDQYRYIHARAIKNKLGVNNLEAWYRLWMVDGEGKGRGLCPVYDTYQYLKSTGQCSGSMKKMKIVLEGGKLEIENISWIDFKALILLKGKDLKEHCAELGLSSNPKLRDFCFSQIASGRGVDLYYANLNGSLQDEDDDDLIDIDEDEDDDI